MGHAFFGPGLQLVPQPVDRSIMAHPAKHTGGGNLGKLPKVNAQGDGKANTYGDEAKVFKLDRRRHERVPLEGTAVAVFHRPQARPLLTSVRFTDASPAGVGVVCSEHIKPGATFTIYPEDASLPARMGVVVRCIEGKNGEWHLGLYSGAASKAA